MKLNDDICIVALPMQRSDETHWLNVSLILDREHGASLVDTGLPGQEDAIASALTKVGIAIQNIKRIILTHQDIDHIGTLHSLVQTTHAQVLAHKTEVPYIDGSAPARFMRPEVLAQRPQMRAIAANFQPTPVDDALEDGSRLDLAGGVRVVFTPGHTVGHMCLYLERTRTLIAGDALTANAGQLMGPSESATEDLPTARRSVQKLAQLDVQSIVCYHGGLVSEDANGQLRRVAAEAAATL